MIVGAGHVCAARQYLRPFDIRDKRCYLTRSAKVTGLLGRAASLLISSSAIWAEEGGCDQLGTV